MEVRLPGRLRFPELEDFLPDRQQEILRKCIESPRLKALSSRYLLASRIVWALLALLILANAAWIGTFVWWQRRSSSELRAVRTGVATGPLG